MGRRGRAGVQGATLKLRFSGPIGATSHTPPWSMTMTLAIVKKAKAKKSTGVRTFRMGKFCDHEIQEADGKKVGEVRVKPNSILWKPSGSQSWHNVTLDAFAKFMVAKGKTTKK